MREMKNKPSVAIWLQQPAVLTTSNHPLIQPAQTWHINKIKKKLTSTNLTKETSNQNFILKNK
jgi:hypothetical protein